jgi:hypothetical protein
MKSRTSAILRILLICEYTILRNLMIMFSFLVAMSFPAVLFTSGACFVDEAFELLKRASLILGMHLHKEPRRRIAFLRVC